MTYIPSVWENIKSKDDFFDGLINKHKNVYNNIIDWKLYSYQSVSWKFNF